jgi:hypothetical protein
MRSGDDRAIFSGALISLSTLTFDAGALRWNPLGGSLPPRDTLERRRERLRGRLASDAKYLQHCVDNAIDALDAVIRNGYRGGDAEQLLSLTINLRSAIRDVDLDRFIALTDETRPLLRAFGHTGSA